MEVIKRCGAGPEQSMVAVVEDLNLGWGLFVVAPGSLSLAERQPGKLVSARTQGFKSLSRRHLYPASGVKVFSGCVGGLDAFL